MFDKSWGILGKPPKSVIYGTNKNIKLFKSYQAEAAKIQKIASAKVRAVKTAELRAKFLRDFPLEE